MRERVIGPPADGVHDPRICVAYGCPLPGVFSNSVLGSSEWLCPVHDGLEVIHWQAATSAIHQRSQLWRLMRKLVNAPPGELIPDATKEGLRTRGQADLVENEYLNTCRKLGAAVRQRLINECKAVKQEIAA